MNAVAESVLLLRGDAGNESRRTSLVPLRARENTRRLETATSAADVARGHGGDAEEAVRGRHVTDGSTLPQLDSNRGTNHTDAISRHDSTAGSGPVLGGDDGRGDRRRDGVRGDGNSAPALASAVAIRLAEARTRDRDNGPTRSVVATTTADGGPRRTPEAAAQQLQSLIQRKPPSPVPLIRDRTTGQNLPFGAPTDEQALLYDRYRLSAHKITRPFTRHLSRA
ncbi:hypothetical protein NL676_025133 [Syzygium grande]|nr:hypothetical protein NL676_025133 [Syzygium grande]